MPPVIAFVVANAVQIAIQVGLTLLELILTPKPPKPESGQTPFKQSRPPRQSGFGECRTSGPYAFFEAAGHYAEQVIAFHDGEVDAVTRRYLNDDRVTIDGSGVVQTPDGNKYGAGHDDRVRFETRLGLPTETAYAITLVPGWSASHRGDGVASMAIGCTQSKAKDQSRDFPNGLPQPSVAARMQKVYDPRDVGQTQGDKSTYLWSDNPALCLLAYLTDAAGGMGLDYARRILPAIDYWKAAADDCDAAEAASGAHAALDADSAAGDDHVTLAAVTGIAGGTVVALPGESRTVDHVSGLAVYFTADLDLSHKAGDVVYWAADGASEKRYRCAGMYKHDQDPADLIAPLLASFDGWMAPRGDGAMVVYSGRYYAPTITFTDQDVISYTLEHFQADESAVNVVTVSFTDPDTEFGEGDGGTYYNDADITARGVERVLDLKLPMVPSAGQAGRLAQRALNRAGQTLRGSLTTNLYGLAGRAERFIGLQISENAELADVVIEVQTPVEIDLAARTVTFAWILADPDIDAGDPGAAVTIPGPGAGRPPPTVAAAPTITSVTPVYDDSGSAIPGARLSLDIAAPDDTDVEWHVRWKTHAGSDWAEINFSDVADGATVTLLTGFVTASGQVDVQAAYRTAAQASPWSATSTATIDPPASPLTTVSLTFSETVANGKLVNIWDDSGTAKVRLAGVSDDSKPTDGFVRVGGGAGDPAVVYGVGQVNNAVSGMTPGTIQFLAASGGLTETRPSSGWLQIVGKSADATHLIFQPQAGQLL